MGTTIRPEMSQGNKYWIERHRYYELKHFCLQYPIWKKARAALDGFSQTAMNVIRVSKTGHMGDPTVKCAEARAFYSDRIEMIENIARETDSVLRDYILLGVTEGLSYDHLRMKQNIPCSRDVYYSLYRRFFWLLDKTRQ